MDKFKLGRNQKTRGEKDLHLNSLLSAQKRFKGITRLDVKPTLVDGQEPERERCLSRYKQRRSGDRKIDEEVKMLRQDLQKAYSNVASLEKICIEHKNKLRQMGFMQKEIENLKLDKQSLLEDITDSRKQLNVVYEGKAKLEKALQEMTYYVVDMEDKYSQEKHSALEDCQRTMEEQFNKTIHDLWQELTSTRSKLDCMKFQHDVTHDKNSQQEAHMKNSNIMQLEEELEKVTEKLKEKKDWEKEYEKVKNSLSHLIGSESKPESQRHKAIMVLQVKLAYMEEQMVRQGMIDEVLADAKKLLLDEHASDIQKEAEESDDHESDPSSNKVLSNKRSQKPAKDADHQEKGHNEDMDNVLVTCDNEDMDNVLVTCDREVLQKSDTNIK